MTAREDIIRELLAGETPYRLSKKYPRASVYRIYNELVQSGQLSGEVDVIHSENLGIGSSSEGGPAFTPTSQTQVKEEAPLGKTGAEVLEFTGPKGLPIAAINRIRGILGITLRPKVLSCPAPELLYPSMIISITEMGWEPMRPDDFIDTVLYQWLDACDYVPYAFIKKSELEEFANKYNRTKEELIKDEKFRTEHGVVTTEEIRQAVLEPLVERQKEMMKEMESSEEMAEEAPEEEMAEEAPEEEDEMESIIDKLEEATESIDIGEKHEVKMEPQPHKPTVGDLLKRLHIDNIRKEIENDGTECSKPNSSQG